MNVTFQKMIADGAAEVRKKLQGAMLFGYPIDPNDPDAILYAAYTMGRFDAAHENYQRSKELWDWERCKK